MHLNIAKDFQVHSTIRKKNWHEISEHYQYRLTNEKRKKKREREREYPSVLSLGESHKSHTIRHVNKSIQFDNTKFLRKKT